jgi:hypothetical protein
VRRRPTEELRNVDGNVAQPVEGLTTLNDPGKRAGHLQRPLTRRLARWNFQPILEGLHQVKVQVMGDEDDQYSYDDKDIAADASGSGAATGGSGRGGATGTPSKDPAVEEPPSEAQERNEAVSGGGMADTTEDDERAPEHPS